MPEWDGHDRRRYDGDLDWHQHKLKILSDLEGMKSSVEEVTKTMQGVITDISVLKVKLTLLVTAVSAGVSAAVWAVGLWVGK